MNMWFYPADRRGFERDGLWGLVGEMNQRRQLTLFVRIVAEKYHENTAAG